MWRDCWHWTCFLKAHFHSLANPGPLLMFNLLDCYCFPVIIDSGLSQFLRGRTTCMHLCFLPNRHLNHRQHSNTEQQKKNEVLQAIYVKCRVDWGPLSMLPPGFTSCYDFSWLEKITEYSWNPRALSHHLTSGIRDLASSFSC